MAPLRLGGGGGCLCSVEFDGEKYVVFFCVSQALTESVVAWF